MSAKDESADPPISNLEDSEGELKNNNTQDRVISESDANANEPQRGDGRTTEEVATLSSLVSHMEEQDKIIIWGTDSQYDDPELAEFEMLECQELEAYLVEEEEEHYEKDPGALRQPVSHNTRLAEPASMKDTVDEGIKTPQSGTKEQGSTLSQSKGLEELSSENDVFVSCLSTMSGLAGSLASALDYAGRTQATDSWQAPSEPYRTLSEDLTLTSQSCLTLSDRSRSSLLTEGSQVRPGKTTAHMGSVDLNLNSTALPEEPLLEAQETPPAPGVDRVPCKERSGLLINGMDECNRSTANAEREHNQSANAEQDTETQRCVPVNDHQLRNKTKADKEPDFDAKATSGHQSDCYQHVTANDTQPNQDRCGVKEHVDLSRNPSKSGSKGMSSHSVAVEPKLRKQGSFERTRSGSPSGLEKRPPWGSPSRSATPPSPKTSWSPRRRPPSSPARTAVTRPASQVHSDSPQKGTSGIKPPSKSCLSSAIPKPIPPPQPPRTESECKNTKSSSPPQKPKNVRPKIITYVRKNSQVKPHSTDGPYEVSTLPPRLTPYASPSATKEQKAGGPKASAVLSSANILYDKYRQEMQKAGYCSSGLVVPGIRPPNPPISQRFVGEAESYHGDLHEKYLHEVGRTSQLGAPEVTGVFRSPRTLRPQLGLGAVARQPSGKTKGLMAGQRSALVASHPPPAAQPTHHHQDPTVEQKRLAAEAAPKAHVAKAGQSGLRLPGFSSLPVARLAAFGFVRSASVSSVSSNQSTDSTHSDPCRPASRLSSGSEDPCLHRASAPLGRSSPQPPNAPAPTRRTLPPPPRSSPVASRKESQTEVAIGRSASSSPKRFAVVSPKPQSPVRQKSCVASLGGANVSVSVSGVGVVRLEEVEAERAALQRLRERCVEQARELLSLQAQLRKAALGLEVFAITTQHFCLKSEATIVRERELSLELARIRDEVAASVSRWERVQGEKEALEERFAREVQGLREQQQKELGALQDRLSTEHSTHTLLLQEEQQHQLRLLHSQHQEQVEAMSDRHETVLSEMESTHNSALATLQEEHARTVKNLRMAHEQQRKSLEEDFEKLRLSLQDQVDTLTFQNRSLRDRAKRFEEALRRSTDEQIVDALAPYQHIEEDLRSLKEVLEMKNQQIHEQELKIAELEKMAQKNVHLEERVQVLQQQNEDLKARIDLNVATSRQLSEENANLQEYVEKESNEKKRLSRTNEELMWRLQTGELSPHMSPTQSPLHRPSPGPASPSRPQSLPR